MGVVLDCTYPYVESTAVRGIGYTLMVVLNYGNNLCAKIFEIQVEK